MLHALIFAPLVAALVTAFIGDKDSAATGRWAVSAALAIAVLGFVVLGLGHQELRSEVVPWFSLWGSDGVVTWSLATDGLSTWLVHLATMTMPLVMLACASWRQQHLRDIVIGAFVMQGAMIGTFLAADLVVFFLFFETMLLPVVVLVARYGDADRRGASMQFFVTTMLASVFLLVAIWYLGAVFGTTQIEQLHAAFVGLPETSGNAATLCFFAFVLAFAVKTPLLPFHAWQARIYAAAPTALTVLLAAVMAKVGIYGFIRLAMPLFPEQLAQWSDLLLILAVVGTLAGALLAMVQTDIKRLLAYASLGHLSLIMAGVLMRDAGTMQGVVVQLVAHGLAVAGLFIFVGALELRTARRGVNDFGGLAQTSPLYAVLLVLSMLSMVAVPGTAAFAGEFMILLGVATADYGSLLLAAVLALSLILTAVYLLRLVKVVGFGPAGETLSPARGGEVCAILILVGLSLLFGCFPRLISQPAQAMAQEWQQAVRLRSSAVVQPLPQPEAEQSSVAVEGVVHDR